MRSLQFCRNAYRGFLPLLKKHWLRLLVLALVMFLLRWVLPQLIDGQYQLNAEHYAYNPEVLYHRRPTWLSYLTGYLVALAVSLVCYLTCVYCAGVVRGTTHSWKKMLGSLKEAKTVCLVWSIVTLLQANNLCVGMLVRHYQGTPFWTVYSRMSFVYMLVFEYLLMLVLFPLVFEWIDGKMAGMASCFRRSIRISRRYWRAFAIVYFAVLLLINMVLMLPQLIIWLSVLLELNGIAEFFLPWIGGFSGIWDYMVKFIFCVVFVLYMAVFVFMAGSKDIAETHS